MRAVVMRIDAEVLRYRLGLPKSVTIAHLCELHRSRDCPVGVFELRIEGDVFPEAREGFPIPSAKALFDKDGGFVDWEILC